jgi:hypothetical protein
MPRTISRRTLGVLAALAAAAATFGMAATAQAAGPLVITSPVVIGGSSAYSNNYSPTVTFTGATPGDTVRLSSAHDADGNGDGSTVADANGDGSIAATRPLGAEANDRENVTLTETVAGNPVGTPASQLVSFDNVPSISGTAAGSFNDVGDVQFFASAAIPGQTVDVTILPVGHAVAAIADIQATADTNGDVLTPMTPPSAPPSALIPGEYSAAMTTIEANGVSSDPATETFYVAPPALNITSLTDGENLNQATPTVTVSGVYAPADVQLYTLDSDGNPVIVAENTASASGNFTFTGLSDLADGQDPLYAVQTINENGTQVSSDGSASPDSPGVSATPINVNVKTAPLVVSSGSVTDGGSTRDNQPYFSAANGLVNHPGNHSGMEFFITGPNGYSTTSGEVGQADGGGDASWQPNTQLADGTYTVTAQSVDDTGHLSAVVSNALTFTVDTIAPATPTVVTPVDGSSVTGSGPSIVANGDTGTRLCVTVDAGLAGEQDLPCRTADVHGNATFALNAALGNGPHTLLISSSDAAGNTSQTSTTFTVNVPVTGGPPPTPTPTPAPTPTPTPTPQPTPKPTPAHRRPRRR